MDVVPVVLSDITTVLHRPPVVPAGRGTILADTPDLLAPDDVGDAHGGSILHDPFGDVNTGKSALL